MKATNRAEFPIYRSSPKKATGSLRMKGYFHRIRSLPPHRAAGNAHCACSSSYLMSFDGCGYPAKRPGVLWRLLRYLLRSPIRLWRFFSLQIILIMILSLICGFYWGWDIGFSDGIDLEYEETVDWLVYQAKI